MATPAAILQILVTADSAQASRSLTKVQGQLGNTETKAHKVGKALGTALKVGAVGAAAGFGYAVTKAADFEQQLDSLGSVAGANGKQMTAFRKQAMKAGADTKYSALEAAKAQTELAKGGLGVKDIMRGGLKSALALAAAGELDLADAATYTANSMNLFGLKGKAASKIADMLATAANSTTADVGDFGEALKQGGSVAKSAGLSFSQTVLALEALAKSGIKGSDAGTSLKTSIIQLLSPSKKQAALADELNLKFIDQQGHFKSLADISDMLRDRLGGMTKAQRTATLATLAGTDGVRTLTSLYDAGSGRLDKWEKQLGKQGTAADVAAKKQDNFRGKLENLQGSVETAAIAIGSKYLPALTDAAEKITDLINDPKLTDGEKFEKFTKMVGDAFEQLAPIAANAAANAAPKAAQAFVNAWIGSSVWGRMVIGGWLFAKLGGAAAFTTLGKAAGASFGLSMGQSSTKAASGSMMTGLKGMAPALAISLAAVFGPELIKAIDEKAHPFARNGLPKTGDELSKGLRAAMETATSTKIDFGRAFADPLGEAGRVAGHALGAGVLTGLGQLPEAEKRLRAFGDTAGATFDRLKEANNVTGFQRLAAQARGLARDFPQAKDALLAFARAADRGADGAEKSRNAIHKAARMSDQFAKNLRGLHLSGSKDFDALVDSVVYGSRRILDVGGKNSEKTRREVARQFNIASRLIRAAMDNDVLTVQEGTKRLHELAKKELALYGISAGKVNVVLAQGPSGASPIPYKQGSGSGQMRPHQRGGYLSGGKPSGDSIPILAERGEGIINRNAVKAIGGPEAIDKINSAVPRFQGGGIVGLGHQLIKQGYEVSENPAFGGVLAKHATNSWHYKGLALDVNDDDAPGGEAASLDRLYARLKGMPGIVELLWRVADHFDHLHVAMSGGGAQLGDLGSTFDGLARVALKGPASVQLEAGQGVLDRVREAADASIAKVAGASVEGPELGGITGVGGSAAANIKLGQAMAARYGWTGGQFAALKTLWMGESGWRTNADNPSSDAYGIPQALPGSKMASAGADWMTNAATQIKWGLGYIEERYGSPASALSFWQSQSPHWYQKGGTVGYVGDSLGQGTVAAGLKGKLGAAIKLLTDNVQGRSSASGLGALKGLSPKALDALVFDVGTNDSTAAMLASSMAGAKAMASGKLVMPTIIARAAEAAKKNAAINSRADKVVDWAQIAGQYVGSDPQGIHPSGAGYDRRASMIAAAVKAVMPDAKGDTAKGKAPSGMSWTPRRNAPGIKEATSIEKQLESIPYFLRHAGKKFRSKKMRGLLKSIRGIDLPPKLLENLPKFENAANIAGDYADRAASLNFDVLDANGDPVLDAENRPVKSWAVLKEKTEPQWVEEQLNNLLSWRNDAIKAIGVIADRRKYVADLIDKALERLHEVAEQIRKAGHAKTVLQAEVDKERKQLDKLREHPKKNAPQIKALRDDIMGKVERIKEITQQQGGRVREKKGLTRILTALGERKTYLAQTTEDLQGDLNTNQGAGSPMDLMPSLPDLGVLGGDILTAQIRLRDLNVKPAPVLADAAAVSEPEPESAELLRELLRQANQRTAVSEAAFGVLRNFPMYSDTGVPFMGQFAKGGVALVGEDGPELAHMPSGTRVHTATDTASMLSPEVHVHINGSIIDVPRGKDAIEVIGSNKFNVAVDRRVNEAVKSALRGRL